VTYWPAYAETLLIWGPVFQQKLQSLGAPVNRLRICGMPAADSLFNRFQNQSSKAANSAAPVCLVFSHAHDRSEEPATFAAYARFLQEAILLLPRVQWRIRLHPAEDDSFYRGLGLAGHSRVQIQSRNISLDEAVAEADVVCTIRSTAGLQAMMMWRPVIVLDLTAGDECSVWWPLHGGGLAVKNSEEFKMAFDQLVDNSGFRDSLLKSQQEFLDKSFANKGNAAAAIVDYLEEQTLQCAETQHSAALAQNASHQ
jgi:CDP-glycerol glycerophosphotransferase (TagB/SpsB family)